MKSFVVKQMKNIGFLENKAMAEVEALTSQSQFIISDSFKNFE